MIAVLLKLLILICLIAWIFSRPARDALQGWKRRVFDRESSSGQTKEPVNKREMIREFLGNRDSRPRSLDVADFYASRDQLRPQAKTATFWKDSLHVWVFASLVMGWLIYYVGFVCLFTYQGSAAAYVGLAIVGAICAFPLVATAMLPFGYDSPRDFSTKDFLLLVLCGAVAASIISPYAVGPSREATDLKRLLLIWPVYQLALSLFGILHWIKRRLF